MQKLADDLARLCREERVGKAIFVGVSIGGYLLFEFWRRYREQVRALVLANTRAGAETSESKATRLQLADKIEREGTAGFVEEMLSKLLAQATRSNRPDIVDAARKMMQAMSPADVAGVQRGIAERADSVATLATINVPALIIAGNEDSIPFGEFELMNQKIKGSELRVISSAGHYAALESRQSLGLCCGSFWKACRDSSRVHINCDHCHHNCFRPFGRMIAPCWMLFSYPKKPLLPPRVTASRWT